MMVNEIYPTLAGVMEAAIKVIDAAIALKDQERATLWACRRQCQQVLAEDRANTVAVVTEEWRVDMQRAMEKKND
jgi:hypothetical protein